MHSHQACNGKNFQSIPECRFMWAFCWLQMLFIGNRMSSRAVQGELRRQAIGSRNLALPPNSCVTGSKLLNLFEPHFLSL